MAAGGDLGGALGSQLVGVITDGVAAMPRAAELALSMGITPEQLGMKSGMLVGMLFPLAGIFVFFKILSAKKKRMQATE